MNGNGQAPLLNRPLDVVTFTILSGGEAIGKSIGIKSIVVEKEVNKIPTAYITIGDGDPVKRDFAISNGDFFKPGMEMEIQAGYHSEDQTIFKGIITKQSIKANQGQVSKMVVECRDVAAKLAVSKRSAFYEELSDSEIIEEILDGFGIEHNLEDTGLVHAELVKFYTTDWDFLVSRAEVNGQLVFVSDGVLEVKAPDFSQEPQFALTYGTTIKAFELELDVEEQVPAVVSKSWDFANQELIEEEGTFDPPSGAPANLGDSEFSDVLYENGEAITLYHAGDVVTEEMQNWASARLMRSRLAQIKGWVRFNGYADIKPGDMVALQGVGERFNGSVFVSAVRHEIFGATWLTTIQVGLCSKWFSEKHHDIAQPPAMGLVPSINGLHLGKVIQLAGDEQDGQHRILVDIPYIQLEGQTAATGIWARLNQVFAGDGRGMVFRPEISDEVLLGFINDDPRDAVVLGALHSAAHPAPIEASDENFEKGIYTLGNLKLVFDDDAKSILLETEAGNSLLISEDEGGIFIQDENDNKVEMTADGIALESPKNIDIKATGDVNIEGKNIVIKGTAQLLAEGGSATELKASGALKIQGATVNIN